MSRARYPRRLISLGPPYDDGTPGDPEPGTRVQFGGDGFAMAPNLGPLTIERLAEMLHEATTGCYEDDRCLEPEHRFRPSGTVHTFDASSLLPMLEPYLYQRPKP